MKVFKTITNYPNSTVFQHLPQFWIMNDISKDDVFQSGTRFACAMYGMHGFHNLDTLRAHLFATMKPDL